MMSLFLLCKTNKLFPICFLLYSNLYIYRTINFSNRWFRRCFTVFCVWLVVPRVFKTIRIPIVPFLCFSLYGDFFSFFVSIPLFPPIPLTLLTPFFLWYFSNYKSTFFYLSKLVSLVRKTSILTQS